MGDHPCQLGILPLGEKQSIGIDNHPLAIALQSLKGHSRLGKGDAATGFDRIDPQFCHFHDLFKSILGLQLEGDRNPKFIVSRFNLIINNFTGIVTKLFHLSVN